MAVSRPRAAFLIQTLGPSSPAAKVSTTKVQGAGALVLWRVR